MPNHLVVDLIIELGGRAYSDATAELHAKLNKNHDNSKRYTEKPHSSFACYLPARNSFFAANNSVEKEVEDEKAKVKTSPIVQSTIHSKSIEAIDRGVINTYTKAIISAASDKVYEVYISNLMRKDNKEQLINSILKAFEDIRAKNGVKNEDLYQKWIAGLIAMKDSAA
ncbi:hypothetical protein BN59_01579 [Legionella massiliensis]|uniref:Uncharacterized protein n=1 Tax=Legionella massiliensis TaxID=1034943 RepID=A0A078KWC1_9GAMM|nr:hypothetical protein [Legionella massiliensis]CDZ77296.1 hypothetical protein BN59_01579 [Legionella massiliensis]CEE13034.1 hypothetical protein BN1094_01579 [Legionella massiliensis]